MLFVTATTDSKGKEMRRLFVYDKILNLYFLVDTGADISVIPAKKEDQSKVSEFKLYAANGTSINTYGERVLDLTLGFCREFSWSFVVADVNYPIIGADLLAHYGLLPDLKHGRLIDSTTGLCRNCEYRKVDYVTVRSISNESLFAELVQDYPGLTQPTVRQECKVEYQTEHMIESTGQPAASKAKRLSPEKLKFAKARFQELLKNGDIRPSKSPWAASLQLAPKKGAEKWRACGDYRRLNAQTVADRYPVPNILDFNAGLARTKVYSVIDIYHAYHQFKMAPGDVEKTAVITPFGLYEYVSMPFGLKNASQTFQRFIDNVLRGLDFAYAYIDDILIALRSEVEHREHVKMVLKRLHEAGLVINIDKCAYAKTEVTFLGYQVTSSGIAPAGDRVKALLDFPEPKTVEGLRRFLGMVNFYRRGIPKAAEIQSRLQQLITTYKKRDQTPVIWTEDAFEAFKEFKDRLAKAAVLAHPEESSDIVLCTDASDIAVGAALHQCRGECWNPLHSFHKNSPRWNGYTVSMIKTC